MNNAIPDGVSDILSRLRAGGYEAYIVGGCVRDMLLGLEPHDYDVCTSALPEQMKECLSDAFRIYETGAAHGTLTVAGGGVSVECTTFRLDGEYSDSRHPDKVSYTDRLSEDLSRRDFTVNAMAMDEGGEVTDLFGGRHDLETGTIRAVGEPKKRFEEDALRILRALRFSSRYGFEIEEKTDAALRAGAPGLRLISRERIASELIGIVMGRDARRISEEYLDVLSFALPSPSALEDGLAPDEVVRLASLMRADASQVSSLKLSNKLSSAIVTLIENRERQLPRDMTSALELLHDLGYELSVKLCEMRGDARALELIIQGQKSGVPYMLHSLAVNGGHLKELGFSGARIGVLLNAALAAVMRGDVPNRKAEILEYIKSECADGADAL